MSITSKAELRDLLLPIAVVAVVGMMILPLPPFLLDMLLMCNIAFALSLLISSVYLSDSEQFTSLPTVLLLATLFRLGLNISTTRQLLSTGVAPDIVAAFGDFVVSGNLVVGVVVFAIVTLVQFLVIAKGAERIAEVAARFTLDAMPGKQMAIDADVRSGIIGLSEAKEKRKALHRESRLFGALDGAMKFVKGDAIAGLLITIINITAGLIVGVSQLGLSVQEAMTRYTLFTIGDGLVSQVPALLVAVAAGIAVTRVENKDHSLLGREMFAQLGREPQAIATNAGVLFILAMVPGLPTFPFLIAAVFLFFTAKRGKSNQMQSEQDEIDTTFVPKIFSPLVFRLSQDAAVTLQTEKQLPNYVKRLRTKLFDTFGVAVAAIEFDLDPVLIGVQVDMYLHGVLIRTVTTSSNEQNEKVELSKLKESVEFSTRVINELEKMLEKHLSEMVDDTQTRILLEIHQPVSEDLINSVIPKLVSVTGLTTMLRQLVTENVSVRDMRTILQAISEYHLREQDGAMTPASLPENARRVGDSRNCNSTRSIELYAKVRESLARAISRHVSNGTWQLEVFVLSPELDNLLSSSSLTGVPLEPETVERLMKGVAKLVEKNPQVQVLLTSRYARAALAQIMKFRFPEVSVLAVGELSGEVKVTVQGRVEFEKLSDVIASEGVDEGDDGVDLRVVKRAA